MPTPQKRSRAKCFRRITLPILTTTPRGRCRHYRHFAEEKSEAQSSSQGHSREDSDFFVKKCSYPQSGDSKNYFTIRYEDQMRNWG